MPRLYARTDHQHFSWILGLLGWSLLLAPVDYRAGASHAHPHAFLQIVAESGHGHYHDDHSPLASPLERRAISRRHDTASPGQASGETSAFRWTSHPDVPYVSDMVAITGQRPTLASLHTHFSLTLAGLSAPSWWLIRSHYSHATRPPSPPPRW